MPTAIEDVLSDLLSSFGANVAHINHVRGPLVAHYGRHPGHPFCTDELKDHLKELRPGEPQHLLTSHDEEILIWPLGKEFALTLIFEVERVPPDLAVGVGPFIRKLEGFLG